MTERRVVIVGGGVVGLFCAWQARSEGFAVTLVERGGPDHDCCSLGNAGQIVPSHFEPLAAPGMAAMALRSLFTPESPVRVEPRIDLRFLRWGVDFIRSATHAHVLRCSPVLRDYALLSRQCYQELAASTGNEFRLTLKGLMMLPRTTRAFEQECAVAETARRLGIEATILTAAQAREIEPAMRMDIAGAVLFPLDAHLVPQRLVAMMTERIKQQGVRILWNTEALSWQASGERIDALVTTQGELTADEFVLAAGSWSPRTLSGLRLRLPVEAGKGYSITLPRPPVLPSVCAVLPEARIAVTPMDGSLRFAGTMQFAGLDAAIEPRRVQAIVDAVPQYLPDFSSRDFAGLPAWAGLRPCTPDGMPLLGRSNRYANFIVATGHAMMGVSLAPATGLLVGEMLAGRRPSIPLELFRPGRFDRRDRR